MDEATSALDPLVEKDLLNSLLLEFDRCIIIMITHKYETLLNCSRVYELKNKILQSTNLASNFSKMNRSLQHVTHKDLLLAIILRSDFSKEGIEFFN